jgi:hypothetical protein
LFVGSVARKREAKKKKKYSVASVAKTKNKVASLANPLQNKKRKLLQ